MALSLPFTRHYFNEFDEYKFLELSPPQECPSRIRGSNHRQPAIGPVGELTNFHCGGWRDIGGPSNKVEGLFIERSYVPIKVEVSH